MQGNDDETERKISRRRLLIASVGSALVASASGFGLVNVREIWQPKPAWKHIKGSPDNTQFDSEVLRTVYVFIGALFGCELSAEDENELLKRLTFAVNYDSGWRTEYLFLSRYVDGIAREMGFKDLVAAPSEQKERLISEFMKDRPRGRISNWIARVSEREWKFRRMYGSTIPHLARLYRYSGVPWRSRGYASWPGVAGDPRAYMEEGPPRRC